MLNTVKTGRKGFVLIELLVVIAIIAIMAAILFPIFTNAQEGVTSMDDANLHTPYETNIFVAGEEGRRAYRIPAIVVSPMGTLLAFCEGRASKTGIYNEDCDMVLKRSRDNGKTWEAMQVIWDDGGNTIHNPCPVVDRQTGTIWLACSRNYKPVFVIKSIDDGATWSTPEEITEDVTLPSWGMIGTGPGHGIQLSSGRLLIPCWWTPYSYVFYSDDHGSSWKLGGITNLGDECEAVETSDGRIYLTMRPPRPGRASDKHQRQGFAWSEDGGGTWSKVQWDESLISPKGQGCQASVVRFTDSEHHDKNRILFSNPASTLRERLTVRLSYDECQTWTAGKVLRQGPAGYSDLCVLPDMTIGCLYEAGVDDPKSDPKDDPLIVDIDNYQGIKFARFTLEWLTNGADSVGQQ